MTYLLFENQFPIPKIKSYLMFPNFGDWQKVDRLIRLGPVDFAEIYYAYRVRQPKSTFFILIDIA
jgi:hypothetical protein